MEAFHWIVVPISTVLGLTIARILSAYVGAFKARRHVRFDWLPLVLAGVVLGEGLQFWWALFELSVLKTWPLGAFALLVLMAMFLFTAAAIVVPAETDADMRMAFERDGKWALLALAFFYVLAIVGNSRLWDVPLRSTAQIFLMALAVLCVTGAMTRRRRWQEAVILIYVIASLADILAASVKAY